MSRISESSYAYDDKNKDIKQRIEQNYNDYISINRSFWDQADIDSRFEAGDQHVFSQIYREFPLNKNFCFNRIRRNINMVSGYQRKNRKSIVVVPVENGDQVTADQFTKVISWCDQREGILNTISNAFHGALVTGLSFLYLWNDYRTDPISGDIRLDYCPYNSFIVDPLFRKEDMSDCNSFWRRSYVTKQQAISLLPAFSDEINDISVKSGIDEKFEFMPENSGMNNKNLLSYDEYYYRAYRKQKVLVDPATSQQVEWTGSESKLREYLSLYPRITVIDQCIPTVRLAIRVGGNVLYDGPNPLGIDSYPIVPVFGYYNPQLQDYSLRIQGIVRGLRDAQFLYNRRRVIELDVAESVATTGMIAKEDAPIDKKDLFKTGQGRVIFLKHTAQMTDVQPMPQPSVPPSFFQLSEVFANEMQQIPGINEELLGSAVDDKAGILSMMRQGNGLIILQSFFDRLDYSQKLLGKIMINIIQNNFTAAKVARIIESEPTPEFYNKVFGVYDAAVEEGFNTTTQRQMQFAQLLNLRSEGVPIPDDVIIEAATLQNKKQLIESIQAANQQRQQLEQMQAQSAMQEQQARVNLANARAGADRGLEIERTSRVAENIEFAKERRAEAGKDRTQSLLNFVKTLQEIDDIDLQQIQKLITISGMLKGSMNSDTVNTQLPNVNQERTMSA
jgi:hypothetical protein